MSSMLNIYIVGLVFVTLIVLSMYIINQMDHLRELEKIRMLEEKMANHDLNLRKIRNRTTACPIKDLTTPRNCYFDSNFTCSWNEDADRCDLKN